MATKETVRKLCYPHPRGTPKTYIAGGVPGGFHWTGGLAHNGSYDFMAPGGSQVLAVEIARVFRLSGHDPREGVVGGSVFGWTTYLMTPDGLMYFYTHQSKRFVKVGEKVRKGQLIGIVGHWPHDEGRSHTHLGVTHPMGDRASRKAARNITEAPHIKAYVPV